MIRLITVWPFCERKIAELAALKRVKKFVVCEINAGQIAYEVERSAGGNAETILAGFMGGRIFTPEELYAVIREAAE
jgi:2-oxoglutarate ferredoxin oxidoreductase subunit alpha